MASVQRKGDSNTAGGSIIVIPQSSVYVNNRLVCVDGSLGTSHRPSFFTNRHRFGRWRTTGGSSTVKAENKNVNVSGVVDTCGHLRVGGSPNTFIG